MERYSMAWKVMVRQGNESEGKPRKVKAWEGKARKGMEWCGKVILTTFKIFYIPKYFKERYILKTFEIF
jgi:hypothetical protein